MAKGVINQLTSNESKACKVLGLEGIIEKDELKKVFRILAKEKHPDRGGNKSEFIEVKEAFDTLSTITPVNCSSLEKEFELIKSPFYGTMRRETKESKTRRYSKYAPNGFTEWREYL